MTKLITVIFGAFLINANLLADSKHDSDSNKSKKDESELVLKPEIFTKKEKKTNDSHLPKNKQVGLARSKISLPLMNVKGAYSTPRLSFDRDEIKIKPIDGGLPYDFLPKVFEAVDQVDQKP